MSLTPHEVFEISHAVYERELEMAKYSSWMTARLTGINAVPPFEKCFPADVPVARPGAVDISAIFTGAGHQVVRAND